MLTLALVFLVLAIIAAVLGFSGIVATSALVFQILFYVLLGIFVFTFIYGLAIKPPKV
ncbi:MAG: DUF1328 domain-containing protein [Fibrobacter sp.]|jgi:uncharacterized membrane protein YtjA (UPF0391 family)|nr:DUF1328 domain-containing protein [Fibrobacter sp.]